MAAERMIRERRCRRILLNTGVLLFLAVFLCSYERAAIWFRPHVATKWQQRGTDSIASAAMVYSELSSTHDGITLNDIVLVIKTGATESLKKLPIHFSTTLQRWPHVLLLSDFAEEIDGHPVHDALDAVSEEIRQESASFELWRRLRDRGRDALETFDPETQQQIQWLAASASDRQAGWHLARFMNLPMTVKARQYKADAKWYVFIDADTFVSWSNTLRLLQHLDHTKPIYLGSQVAMGPGEFFGHGGSGYVLSQIALARVVEKYQAERGHWDAMAEEGDFGEVPLARALLSLQVPLTWGFPHFQGGNPHDMDFGGFEHGRKVWCYPAVTFHHANSESLNGLSEFEDAWVQSSSNGRPLRFSDVFKSWMLPSVDQNSGRDWDNFSNHLLEGVSNAAGCREACHSHQRCLQYSFQNGECRTDEGHPKIGRARIGTSSGWVMERVRRLVQELDRECEESILV